MAYKEQYFGLDKLDLKLSRQITQPTGFFVELGAFDGIKQSNTLYFERKGWRGILIEPIPQIYRKCVVNRPLGTVVNCACVSAHYPLSYIEMTYAGLMSIVKGTRKNADADEKWMRRGEQIQQLTSYDVRVPARTLTSILEEYNVKRVDVLSLDVEGFEIEVLKGLDFTRFRPLYIVLEDSGIDDVGSYLRRNDYNQVAVLVERKFTRDILFKTS